MGVDMTFYKDMDLCDYHEGAYSAENWDCPLLTIGWIEFQHGFSVGEVSDDLLAKLKVLTKEFGEAFPGLQFRGLHACSICENATDVDTPPDRYVRVPFIDGKLVLSGATLDDSCINLFLPGKNVVFIAPGRIDHYIEVHSYRPPEEFLLAVKNCESPLSRAYAESIRAVNFGNKPLLYETD